MTIGFVNAIYLNCNGMAKERNSTWYVTYQLPGWMGKIQNKGFCSPIIITFSDNFRTVRSISGILKIGQCYNLHISF